MGRGYRKRATRIQVRYEAVLIEPDGCRIAVTILDVSRSGFRLESDAELLAGEEVQLLFPKLKPVRAAIQWTRGREAGGTFLESVAL